MIDEDASVEVDELLDVPVDAADPHRHRRQSQFASDPSWPQAIAEGSDFSSFERPTSNLAPCKNPEDRLRLRN